MCGKIEGEDTKINANAYVEGTEQFQQRTGLLIAPVRISLEMMKEEGRIPVCVLNITDKPIRVYREQSVATFQPLSDSGNEGHFCESSDNRGPPYHTI